MQYERQLQSWFRDASLTLAQINDHEERLKKMIAAGRQKMDQEFCKGMALTIAIYGLLTAVCVFTALN